MREGNKKKKKKSVIRKESRKDEMLKGREESKEVEGKIRWTRKKGDD